MANTKYVPLGQTIPGKIIDFLFPQLGTGVAVKNRKYKTECSVTMINGRMVYFTSAATIKQLSELPTSEGH
jgi:hypothetical protein